MNKQILLFFSLFLFSLSPLVAQSTFINEVNYLASDPLGKGLEIAGESGENLAGWSLVFYGLDGAVSAVEELEYQLIPSQQNGYGTVWYEMEQMSGGQGVALINPTGVVEQFLGYGLGALLGITATEGPASGMTSQYIGSQLLPDQSLQLVGLGLSYLDFSWLLPSSLTDGDVNTGQLFGLIRALLPLFNEVETTSETNLKELTFKAFPNPTTDYIRVQWSVKGAQSGTDINLYLFDAAGRLLKQNRFTQDDTIAELDLTDLAAGQYFLRLGEGPQARMEKIVKR